MPIMASIGATLKGVQAGTWIDVACLVIVAVMAIIDARRGISATIAALLGLFAAINFGLWFCPVARSGLLRIAFFSGHPHILNAAALLEAIIAGAVVHIVVRAILTRFFKLVVVPPLDNILGAFAGIAKALMVILALFACASLLPRGAAAKAAHESRAGRKLVPAILRTLGAPENPSDIWKRDRSKR